MRYLEDNLDSVLLVHILIEHVVISFNLYQSKAEKGAIQRSLPVNSIQKLQTDTVYLKIDLRCLFSIVCMSNLCPWLLHRHFQKSFQIFIIHYFVGITFSVFPDQP